MTNGLQCKREQTPENVVILKICGRMDMSALEDFKNAIHREFSQNLYNIILCLEEVPFIVSTHLGVIMQSFKTATSHGGQFILCSLQHDVHQIFDLLQLTTVLTISPTLEDALKEF
jgi:anti-anti-sigma factor